MAITATFSADFQKWNEGLRNAQASLKSFELSTVGVKQQLQRMVSGFDGSKIIRDAQVAAAAVAQIGGAAKLTASEQRKVNATVTEAIAKYHALGESAPKELHDLAEATKQVAAPTVAATESVGDLVAKYVTIGAAIALAKQAFSALTDFIGSSVRSFASAEAAQTRLVTALRAQGTATPEVIGQYHQLSSAIQRTTAFSDDAADAMEALFVQVGNVGPAQMEKATTAATDLAAGLGIDLEQAATLVSKALAGNTGALGRYGVKLDEARVAAEGADYIFGQLQERFGGQAAAQLETYAGKLAQLENAWDNVKEAVGKFVVTNEVSTAALAVLSKELTHASDEAETAAPSIAQVWVAMGQSQVAAAGIALLEDYLSLVNQANRGANVFAEAVRKGTATPPPALPLPQTLPNISGAGIAEWERQNDALDRAKKAAEAARKSLMDLRDELSGAKMRSDIVQLGKAWDALTEDQRQSALSIDTTGKKYLQLIPAVAKVPPELRKTVTEMNRVAIAAGLMDETIQQGALSVGLFSKELQSIDGPAGDAVMAMVAFESHVTNGADLIGKFGEQLGKPEFSQFPKTMVRMSEVTGQLAQGFVNLAQVSGGTFSTITKNIGKIAVGFDNALKGFETFKDNFIKNGQALKGVGLQMAASIGAGLLSGFGSIMDATSSASLLKNVLGGAQAGGIAGAGIGAAIALGLGKGAMVGGVWGAIAGAAVGIIVGAFRGAHTRALMKQVGRDWGVSINEGMAKELQQIAKNDFGGDLDAAKLFKLDEILGDVNTDTVVQYGKRLHDVFSALETGAFSAAQAQTVLNKSFKQYAEFVTQDGALASQALLDLIALNDRFGTHSAAVSEFVAGEASKALGGLSTFLENTAVSSQTAATGIASAIAAIAGSLEDVGATPLEALQQVGPLVEKLDAQLKKTGFSGGAAFASLKSDAALASDAIAGPLLSGAAALGTALEGLHNSDILDQTQFAGIVAQITATRNQLVGMGKDGDQVNRLIGSSLQTAWELEKDFGYQVDAATQKLLDEAEAAGIVGDQHRSAQQQMQLALDRTANAVEQLVVLFGGTLPGAIEKTRKAIDRIPDTVRVKVNYEDSGFRSQPSGPTGGTGTRTFAQGGPVVSMAAYKASNVSHYLAAGGPVHKAVGALAASALLATAMPAQAMAPHAHATPAALYAATGTFVAKGTDTVPAMLTPGEYVLPTSVVQKQGLPALDALRSGQATVVPSEPAGSSEHRRAATQYASGGSVVFAPPAAAAALTSLHAIPAHLARGGQVVPTTVLAAAAVEPSARAAAQYAGGGRVAPALERVGTIVRYLVTGGAVPARCLADGGAVAGSVAPAAVASTLTSSEPGTRSLEPAPFVAGGMVVPIVRTLLASGGLVRYLAAGGITPAATAARLGALAASGMSTVHGSVPPARVAPAAVYAATGTFVPHGTDTVPAMLTPGEYVLPTKVVQKEGVPALDALRAGDATIQTYREQTARAVPIGPGSDAGGPATHYATGGLVDKASSLDYLRQLPSALLNITAGITVDTTDAQKQLDELQKQPPIQLDATVDRSSSLDYLRDLPNQLQTSIDGIVLRPPPTQEWETFVNDMGSMLGGLAGKMPDIADGMLDPDPITGKWETFVDDMGQVWTIVGGIAGKVKGDLNQVGDLLGGLASKAPDLDINVSADGLETIISELQTVRNGFDFTLHAQADGIETVLDSVNALPAERDIAATVRLFGLEGVQSGLATIPRTHDVSFVAKGLPDVKKGADGLPDSHDVTVQYVSSGLAAILAEIAKIPRVIDVAVRYLGGQPPGTPAGPAPPLPRSSQGSAGYPIPVPPVSSGGSFHAPGGGIGTSTGSGGSFHLAQGGLVPAFYAAAGRYIPRGTDTVLAGLTPGEGVLNTRAMAVVGAPLLNQWNRQPESLSRLIETSTRLDSTSGTASVAPLLAPTPVSVTQPASVAGAGPQSANSARPLHVNFHISALDGADVTRVLKSSETRNALRSLIVSMLAHNESEFRTDVREKAGIV